MQRKSTHLLLLTLAFALIAIVPGAASSGPAEGVSVETFSAPSAEYRPWVRWWWPGGDVEVGELTREVELLSKWGFGGAEVQPFTMGLDPKPGKDELERRYSFDTPAYYSKLGAVMEAARKHGLVIDLNLGTGWPSGGGHIGPDQGLKTLLWNERIVKGPKNVRAKLKGPKKPLFYYLAGLASLALKTEVAEYLGDRAELKAVLAARVTGGKRSLNPIDQEDSIEIDPASIQVITDRVDNGRIEWDAPAGKWAIVEIYEAPNGEKPTLCAKDDCGFAVDPLDRDSAIMNVERFLGERTGLEKFFGDPLRAFFNDSFEFKVERHTAPDFAEEFERRRGYALTPRLLSVLVPGGDNFFYEAGMIPRAPYYVSGQMDARVRYDYSLTVSDLFIERFLDASSEWAGERGLQSRAQCYGMDMDVIRASGHADIPETEQLYAGGSEMFLKMASSGALLYGRPLITAETAVWSGRDYMTTPLKVKAAADKLFTSGINGVIFHGYSYKKDEKKYGESGWYPWSSPFVPLGVFSSNLSEANPYWKYMPTINRYIARCQYVLRQGKPKVDLLVYYPWLGFPSSFSAAKEHEETLFNGKLYSGDTEVEDGGIGDIVPVESDRSDPRVEWLLSMWPLLEDLSDHGYTWAWVNDESLEEAVTKNGKIYIRGSEFKAVVIANTESIGFEAAKNLAELSDGGAAFMLASALPARQHGFHDQEKRDPVVRAAMEKVLAGKRSATYQFMGAAGMVMASVGVSPAVGRAGESHPVKQAVRKLDNGDLAVFMRNDTATAMMFPLDLEAGCGRAFWLNPWDGRAFPAEPAVGNDGIDYYPAVLDGFGSMVFICEADDLAAGRMERKPEAAQWMKKSEMDGPASVYFDVWRLEVVGDDVKGGKFDEEIELNDWRDIRELRYSSSPGVYSIEFELGPETMGKHVELDLGWVHGAAEVKINGKDAGVLLAPHWGMVITDMLVEGENRVEVTVVPPLRNRYIGYAEKPFSKKRYKQFRGKDDTLAPAGMVGPARIMVWTPRD